MRCKGGLEHALALTKNSRIIDQARKKRRSDFKKMISEDPRYLAVDKSNDREDWFLDYSTREPAASRAGAHYTAANGDPIFNKGEKILVMSDAKGNNIRQMKFQVCEVTKALGSVMKIVKNGNRVIFDDSGSYIEHKATGGKMWLKEHEGVYVLDCLVAPAAEAQAFLNNNSGFGWQARS